MDNQEEETTLNSNYLRKEAAGLMEIKAGDVVRRIWGNGYLVTEMRVEKVDEVFIYCDAMRSEGAEEWENVLPPENSDDRWKFDLEYGVETDENMGWGVIPYAARNIVLTRIVPLEVR